MARVALVCEPPDGGVAEHVRRLALDLGAYGHEAVVFGPRGLAGAAELDAFHALPLTRDYSHPQRDAAALASLLRGLRGFDIVHGHAAKAGVLEAQACGVPQVATDVGGTREAVVPDTGILVAPHDPVGLASALAELLLDRERRVRMGRASRARHAERFTAGRMVRETAAVYDDVLRRAAARPRAGRRARRR